MRTARLVLTPLEWRKSIMSRMTFCSSHASLIRFRRAGQHLGTELEAKLPVLHPAPLGCEPFPGADRWQGANHGRQVAVPLGFDLEHAESAVLV